MGEGVCDLFAESKLMFIQLSHLLSLKCNQKYQLHVKPYENETDSIVPNVKIIICHSKSVSNYY